MALNSQGRGERSSLEIEFAVKLKGSGDYLFRKDAMS